MESIVRKVRDLDARERQLLEHVLGQPVRDDQQVIIRVVTLDKEPAEDPGSPEFTPSGKLPDWCDVFAGLTEDRIAELEGDLLRRADLTRSSK